MNDKVKFTTDGSEWKHHKIANSSRAMSSFIARMAVRMATEMPLRNPLHSHTELEYGNPHYYEAKVYFNDGSGYDMIGGSHVDVHNQP